MPPRIAQALGRADRTDSPATGWMDVPASAALSRLGEGDMEADAVREHRWLRAEPAWIRPDINGARLLGIGDALGIEQADVEALLPALRPLFGDAGFTLDAPTPSRWYLRLPREAKLPAFASPDDALGDDVFEHIVDGPEARRWRVLASEAQVTLHNHPRNAQRIAAGKVPINSLWFWGGGLLPDSIASGFPTVFSDDVLLHGIARIGKLDAMPMKDATLDIDDALVDLRAVRDPRAVVESWLAPVAASVSTREAVFDFADGQVFTLRANQRWRFWRKPLAVPA